MTLHGRSASLLVNQETTKSFPLTNGVPQGDAVAPYLFILLMEILLFRFRHEDLIVPLNPGSDIKVQSFADDLTLLLNGDIDNVNRAIDLIKQFTLVSGLKINVNKTQLMPINHDGYSAEELDGVQQCTEVKLLGIYYDSQFEAIAKNADDKFNSLNAQSFKWSSAHLNIDGRIIIARSVMSSIFHNLGIQLGLNHKKLAWEVDKRINLYLWSGSHKVSVVDTRLPKEMGGLAMINSEEMWLSFRIKALLRIFQCEEKWATDLREDMQKLYFTSPEALLNANILELKFLAQNLSCVIGKLLVNDLVEYQILHFSKNPANILNERVFYNYWGSTKLPLEHKPTPVTGAKNYNYTSGLRADLLGIRDTEMTYFQFIEAFYAGRLNLNPKQRSYLSPFMKRINKILLPTMIAAYSVRDRFGFRARHCSKLRKLLLREDHSIGLKNFVYRRWDKRLTAISLTDAQLLIANLQFKMVDSRMSDFRVRLICIMLGFRKQLAKYKQVDPKCFMCSDPNAKHDLLHTFYDCTFAVAARRRLQAFVRFPQEFNLMLISETDFFVGISNDRAQQLALSQSFVNQVLFLLKYNLWTCSLSDDQQFCLSKVTQMNLLSIRKLMASHSL